MTTWNTYVSYELARMTQHVLSIAAKLVFRFAAIAWIP